jgi:hypothetical protein
MKNYKTFYFMKKISIASLYRKFPLSSAQAQGNWADVEHYEWLLCAILRFLKFSFWLHKWIHKTKSCLVLNVQIIKLHFAKLIYFIENKDFKNEKIRVFDWIIKIGLSFYDHISRFDSVMNISRRFCEKFRIFWLLFIDNIK